MLSIEWHSYIKLSGLESCKDKSAAGSSWPMEQKNGLLGAYEAYSTPFGIDAIMNQCGLVTF